MFLVEVDGYSKLNLLKLQNLCVSLVFSKIFCLHNSQRQQHDQCVVGKPVMDVLLYYLD